MSVPLLLFSAALRHFWEGERAAALPRPEPQFGAMGPPHRGLRPGDVAGKGSANSCFACILKSFNCWQSMCQVHAVQV